MPEINVSQYNSRRVYRPSRTSISAAIPQTQILSANDEHAAAQDQFLCAEWAEIRLL
jgi:hypothetical protein